LDNSVETRRKRWERVRDFQQGKSWYRSYRFGKRMRVDGVDTAVHVAAHA
jgi:hypothetical protein